MTNTKFNDPIIQELIKKYPVPVFEDKSENLYQSLVESVISQQLSIKAADTITARFVALFETESFPKPSAVLQLSEEKMRGAGLSYAKIGYVKNISQAFLDGTINPTEINHMNDEEVINTLIQIKGIGRWTAEMTLIFTLRRPDVFSIGDNGLQRAITNLYKITDKKEMVKLSESWKPHRSIACWYLWRSLEND